MRRLLVSAVAALALAGCGFNLPQVATPSTVANATVLDEQVGRGAELAYKLGRTVLELAVDTGRVKGATAAKAQDLNRKAYAALLVMRTAYRAGNATGYKQAAAEVGSLVAQLHALI